MAKLLCCLFSLLATNLFFGFVTICFFFGVARVFSPANVAVLAILLNICWIFSGFCRWIGWRLAGVLSVWLCEIGITCLAALRSYTLFGLSGCIVKFSFLVTFLRK